MESNREQKGRDRLKSLGCSSRIGPGLDKFAPDLSRYIREFAFGDVHSRPGLGPKERELIIVAALTTLGHAQLELESHLNMALNVGWTREEILEIMIQLSVYAGFPTAVNGAFVAQKVFAERDQAGDNET